MIIQQKLYYFVVTVFIVGAVLAITIGQIIK